MKRCRFLFLFIVIAVLFFNVGCDNANNSKSLNVESLWRIADVKATGDLVNGSGGLVLTREVTLFQKPPFYNGKMPMVFLAIMKNIAPGMSMGEVPLQYIFDDFGVLFIYKDTMSMFNRMPEGAVAVDMESKTIIAECKVLRIINENNQLNGFELQENHYNSNGDVNFSCIFKVDAIEGFKKNESSVLGKKEREYFFLWPGLAGSF